MTTTLIILISIIFSHLDTDDPDYIPVWEFSSDEESELSSFDEDDLEIVRQRIPG